MKLTNGSIAVAGAGRMGRGISLSFAYQGYPVTLIDIKNRPREEFLQLKEQVINDIRNQLEIFVLTDIVARESVENILQQIEVCSINDSINSWSNADVLFEAVPEIIEVKKSVFASLCEILSEKTIIASTTSSFSANDLAPLVQSKERFLNTHWLNPAYLMPLVEVSPSKSTSQESTQKIMSLLKEIGKVPIICAPSPGYIVPRIQTLAMNEASRLVEEGVATVEDIDKASTVGFGLRFAILGLLEFIDWGGADILYHASNSLKDSTGEERFAPPKIIEEKMKTGEIGMREGKGFYKFEEKNINQYQIETLKKFVDLLKHLGYIGEVKKQYN